MWASPRVAIRVDASATMGTGHLRRCVTLAHALNQVGARTLFVCRRLDSVVAQVLAIQHEDVHWLPAPTGADQPDAGAPSHAEWAGVSAAVDGQQTIQALRDWRPDWVVVDHYAFDDTWHRPVRQALGCRMLVIDDLGDRRIDADVLLDQNWHHDHRRKYADLVPQRLTWLTGPKHALLAPVYRHAPRCVLGTDVNSIGIFMGGTDPGGVSVKVMEACRHAGFTGPLEVVSTSANPHLVALRQACAADGGTQLTLDEVDLAGFFARHGLQIGAGGGATWERCCIGAPSIGLVLAANQAVVVPALDRLGVLRAARIDDASGMAEWPALTQVLSLLLRDTAARTALGQRAALLVDGCGAQRVALSLLGSGLALRPATLDDARLLHGWRDHPSVRAVSVTQHPIAFEDHERWMRAVLANPARWLFVGQLGSLPVGSIRFDGRERGCMEVSLYLDPDFQGLGLGRHLLAAGERALLALHPTGVTVHASVLPDNASSQRLFEASGYQGGPLRYHKPLSTIPTVTLPTS